MRSRASNLITFYSNNKLITTTLANLKSLIWPGWRILKIPETSTVDFFNIDLMGGNEWFLSNKLTEVNFFEDD